MNKLLILRNDNIGLTSKKHRPLVRDGKFNTERERAEAHRKKKMKDKERTTTLRDWKELEEAST